MMSTLTTWKLLHCSGYIVPPCKDLAEDDAWDKLQGSPINIASTPIITTHFQPLFEEIYDDCRIPITFVTANNDGEENSTRDLVRRLAFSADEEVRIDASKKLALKLALVTDHRSPTGLMIIVVGYSESTKRYQVVIWKFPADESLQALVSETGITIQIVKGAFSRNTKYFKAAAFRGEEADKSFQEGHVEDRQTNQKLYEGSRFWIEDFLMAQPNITSQRGTKILARVVREIINNESSYTTQENLVAAVIAVKSQTKREITLGEFAERYLPEDIRENFERQIGKSTLEVPFMLDASILDEEFAIRTLIIAAGAERVNVSAPIEDGGNIIEISPSSLDGETQIVIKGRIIGSNVRMVGALK